MQIIIFVKGKNIDIVYYHKTFNNLHETMKRLDKKGNNCIKRCLSEFQLTIILYRRMIMANIFVQNSQSFTSKMYTYHLLLKEKCVIVTIFNASDNLVL